MTSKHTPGPWKLAEKFNCVEVRAVDGPYIANCNQSAVIDWRIKEANARLIAAAPEGLEVAEFVYQALLRHPVDAWRIRADGQQSLCVLRSFIASATGRSEQEVQEFYEAAVAGEATCAT